MHLFQLCALLLLHCFAINAQNITGVHIDPKVNPMIYDLNVNYSSGAAGAFAGHQLNYYGGYVLNTVNIFPIFYGPNTQYIQELLSFYSGIANSTYFDWLVEYSNNKTINGTGTSGITRGYVSGSYWEKSTSLPNSLLDTDVKEYISGLIQKKIIIPTANSYFPVHFQKGIEITTSTGFKSCQKFCAYHGTLNLTGLVSGIPYLSYGVIPDQRDLCTVGCGSDPILLNNLQSVSSHELVEAITDPGVDLGLIAWFGPNGEIGDLCNHIHGQVLGGDNVTYVVQKQYSNQLGQCIVDKPGIPPRLVPNVTTEADFLIADWSNLTTPTALAIEVAPISISQTSTRRRKSTRATRQTFAVYKESSTTRISTLTKVKSTKH